MVVSVTASTTQGKPLTKEELGEQGMGCSDFYDLRAFIALKAEKSLPVPKLFYDKEFFHTFEVFTLYFLSCLMK